MHRAASAELEPRIQQVGRGLIEAARRQAHRSWREDLIGRLLADDALRTRMLRFVDALPALDHDAELGRHLHEYFGDLDLPVPLPGLAQWSIKQARSGIAAHVIGPIARSLVLGMARRFIAGETVAQATHNLHHLHRRGMGFTLDLLGEATVSEAEADAYQRSYLALLNELAPVVQGWGSPESGPRLNLSLKVSALYSQLDPVDPDGACSAIAARLRSIFRRAIELGAFITLDMEQYDFKAATLRVFREMLMEDEFRRWPHVGIALQAYLRGTPDDLAELIRWAEQRGTPVTVRLVRGAYWDFEVIIAQQNGWPVPVWTEKSDTDACYEACLRTLLEAYPLVRTAVATHNARSLAVAIVAAEALGLSRDDYEFQMLYGMADPLKHELVKAGHRLRVYTPFGPLLPGMAYLVRRLLENSSSQSFLRMGLDRDTPVETLLRNPLPRGEGGPLATGVRASAVPSRGASTSDAVFENEPVRRFVDDAERQAFAAALATVRNQLGRDYPLVIDSQERRTAEQIISPNPAHPDQVVGRVASAGAAEAEAAAQAAERAFPAWRDTPVPDRAALLLRAAALLRQRRDELSAWEVLEAGKPWREADADVCEAIDFLEYYSREAVRLARGWDFNVAGETNHHLYEPRGVCAVIAPWNFPLAILAGMTVAALATGNTVVMKPAPQTPVIAAKLMEVMTDAGLPVGVLNYLPGGDEAGVALVAHPLVATIAFTGSQAVGDRIRAVTALAVRDSSNPGVHRYKHVIAEMGGKNAIIIDSDADLDDAVRGTLASALGYQGQKCSAASRVIVVGDLYEPFLKRLVAAAKSIRIGDPADPGTLLGPVIDAEARERIRRAIDAARSVARLILDVDVSHLPGTYIGPTIFADPPPDSPLAQEEIFGPVLAAMQATDFDHALALANGTPYALTGGVYSRSPAHLEQARREFRVGNLYLNRRITGAIVGRQPFGGLKLSGLGSRAGGPDYLLQFVEARTVTENQLRHGFAPEV